jgi:hypothetical protein
MGVPTSEVGYTSATTGRGDHEVHDGHVVALENSNNNINFVCHKLTSCFADDELQTTFVYSGKYGIWYMRENQQMHHLFIQYFNYVW